VAFPQIHSQDYSKGGHAKVIRACLACALLVFSAHSYAEEDTTIEADESSGWKISGWNIQTSLYTKHWDSDPDHTNHQKLIGPELVFENNYLVGLAIFRNSFDQPSQFLYIGKTWRLFRTEWLYFKLVGGLLHGYKTSVVWCPLQILHDGSADCRHRGNNHHRRLEILRLMAQYQIDHQTRDHHGNL